MDTSADRPRFEMQEAEIKEFLDEFVSGLDPADESDGPRSIDR